MVNVSAHDAGKINEGVKACPQRDLAKKLTQCASVHNILHWKDKNSKYEKEAMLPTNQAPMLSNTTQ